MLKRWIKKLLQRFKKRKESDVSNGTTVNLPKYTLTHSKNNDLELTVSRGNTNINIPVEMNAKDESREEKIKKDKSLMITATEANRLAINKILNKEINKETLDIITDINQYILEAKSFQWILYISNKSAIDYTYICQYYECLGYKIIKQTRTITIEWSLE